MSKLIIASNRLPVYLENNNNIYRIKESVSGLVSAVKSLNPKVWIGLTGCAAKVSFDNRDIISEWEDQGYNAININNDRKLNNFEDYIANLWAVFHSQIGYVDFTDKQWGSYKEINGAIADRIAEYYEGGDIVLLHDFQICLVSKYLRENPKTKGARINLFLHIPFPSLDIFRTIPNGKELISSLLECDKIQFHTIKDSDNFWQVLDYYNPHSFENNRFPKIEVNPIGVDIKKIEENADSDTAKIFAEKILDAYPTDKIILSVGRLDFTKGLEQMLKSFEYILKNTDERPILYLVAVMTRKGSLYQQLIKKIDQMVAKINGVYSIPGYVPIFYTNNGLSAQELAGLYSVSDVCWVNSISDGYNLVSSEYIVANPRGHLVLSEFAGASQDFRGDFNCNPYDTTKTAEKVLTGLQRGNCGSLRGKVRDISEWTEKLL